MPHLAVRSLFVCLLGSGSWLHAQLTLASYPNPSSLGQPVTLSVTITGIAGSGGSNTVAFYDGATLLGSRPVLEGGVAILTTSLLPPGTRSLRARFQNAISDPVQQVVTPRPSYALSAPAWIPAGPVLANIVAADFNGDGKVDVAVATNGLSIVLNGDSAPSPPAFPMPAMSGRWNLAAADFDGDGNLDVAASSPAGIFIFSGTGTGNFKSSTQVGPPATQPYALAVGDFNGDGVADLAAGLPGGLTIYLSHPGASFTSTQYSYDATSVGVADFNGDGIADIATPAGVALGNGDGTFQTPIAFGPPGSPSPFVVAGDLNNDGKPDLVVRDATSSRIEVHLGKGDGTFRIPPIVVLWPYLEPDVTPADRASMSITDINGDGIPDLVIGSSDVQIFFGAGDGTFTSDSPLIYRVGFPVEAVATADWNGDGAVDVIFGSTFTLGVLNSFSFPKAALNIGVTHAAPVLGSGSVTYTITVGNSANADPTSGTVVVAETRSGSFSMSGDGWTCIGQSSCSRSDSLAPGANYPPITATLTNIDPRLVTGPFANTVTAIGGSSRPVSATDTFQLPPLKPILSIANGATDVPLNSTLNWSGPGAAFFDVYFGTSSPPPLAASNFVGTTYNPGALAPCTTYYWQAIAKSAGVNVSSAIYSFTTMASVQLSRDVDLFAAAGGPGSVQITSSSSCPWKLTASTPNVVNVGGPTTGIGDATLTYTVQPNSGSASRSGFITIANQTLAILQDGTGPSTRCATRISGPPFIDSTQQTVTLNVTADANCNWSLMDTLQSWVTLPGPQDTPTFTASANTSGAPRSDAFTAVPVATAAFFAPFTVTQRATPLTFADVPIDYTFFDAIGFLRARAITDGCASAPLRFCPDDNITRGQMAVFIIRSIMGGDSFTYSSTPYFSDTPATHPFFKWIQKMWELGITNGCGPTTYCPDSAVTRGQMAVFIIRARLGATASFSYPPDPLFNDISGNFFYPSIQKMGQLGITTGCAPRMYCPDAAVTRGQMAVFIMRGAFNQLLPFPRPIVASVSPNSAAAGQTVTVTITGQNTYFNGGPPQVAAGPGMTVSNVTVVSASVIVAQFTVAANAAPGPHSITVTVPGEIEATLPNGFRVQ